VDEPHGRKHDVIFWYSRGDEYTFKKIVETRDEPQRRLLRKRTGGAARNVRDAEGNLVYYEQTTKQVDDVWRVPLVVPASSEYKMFGYPTQKPEALLERIIISGSNEGEVIADFFCGGGTTAAVAQRLSRRWIACDQSRVAVAISTDRLTTKVEEGIGKILPVPDFTVEQ
jgi:adenine-specific DNA-methyltransferase